MLAGWTRHFCLLQLFWGSLYFSCVNSETKTLYSSISNDSDDLEFYSAPGRTRKGWYKVEENGNIVYKACDRLKNIESFLKTPSIDVNGAKNVKIILSLSTITAQCKSTCPSKLQLGYIEGPQLSGESKAQYFDKYTMLKNKFRNQSLIYYDWTNVALSNMPKNNEISIVLKDTGACTTIQSITVTTEFCPRKVAFLAEYPSTFTHIDGVIVDESGNGHTRPAMCVENARVLNGRIMPFRCGGNGLWEQAAPNDSHTGCFCLPGYQPSSDQRCQRCTGNTYKSTHSNSKCLHCPQNSRSDLANHLRAPVACVCEETFTRLESESVDKPCGKSPSPPQHIKSHVEFTTVKISWERPLYDGLRSPLTYTVFIKSNVDGAELRSLNTSRLYAKMTALSPETLYTVIVEAHNVITRFLKRTKAKAYHSFRSAKRIPIRQPKVNQHEGTILVQWDADIGEGFKYAVELYENGIQAQSTRFTNMSSLRIEDQDPTKTYAVKLGVKYNESEWFWSDKTFATKIATPTFYGIASLDQLLVSVVVVFVILVLIFVLIMAAFLMLRMKNTPLYPTHGSFIEQQVYGETKVWSTNDQEFVEPLYYEGVEVMLSQFTRDLESDSISIYEQNSGKFGEYVPGYLRTLESEDLQIWCKFLDPQANKQKRRLFALEASICGQFNHANVQMLYGVYRKGSPMIMTLEFTGQGSLLKFIQQNPNLASSSLVHMLRGVACGMQYLSGIGYIHKVLTANNTLVSSNNVCKISGFDMRANLDELGDNMIFSDAELLFYQAPEVVRKLRFSPASDVWSFGVLLWEVMAREDSLPYKTPAEITKLIESEIRLRCPPQCPPCVYSLMLECWHDDPLNRPVFSNVKVRLEVFMRFPRQLEETFQCNPMDEFPFQHMPTTLGRKPLSNSIKSWLDELKLSKYYPHFATRQITDIFDVIDLREKELEQLGVRSHKHRKLMLASLKILRQKHVYWDSVHQSEFSTT